MAAPYLRGRAKPFSRSGNIVNIILTALFEKCRRLSNNGKCKGSGTFDLSPGQTLSYQFAHILHLTFVGCCVIGERRGP